MTGTRAYLLGPVLLEHRVKVFVDTEGADRLVLHPVEVDGQLSLVVRQCLESLSFA